MALTWQYDFRGGLPPRIVSPARGLHSTYQVVMVVSRQAGQVTVSQQAIGSYGIATPLFRPISVEMQRRLTNRTLLSDNIR
jgi:hypothetical protein